MNNYSIHSLTGIALAGRTIVKPYCHACEDRLRYQAHPKYCPECRVNPVLLLLGGASKTVGAVNIVTALQDNITPPSPKNNVERRLAKYTNKFMNLMDIVA